MLVEEDNMKLKNEIVEWQTNQTLTQIQKKYDEKYAELQQLEQNNIKGNQSIVYANIVTYLQSHKEDAIMKKVMLDICFQEVSKGLSLF